MRTIMIIAALMLCSCATVDIAVRDASRGSAPNSVLIGFFESRVLDFNPYTAKNFRDFLAYEFFARGYTVIMADSIEKGEESRTIAGDERAADHVRKQPADLFVQGIIFESRYGDAIEDTTSTSITVHLYDKSGSRIGTARCISSDSLNAAGNVRSLSKKIVSSIHSRLSK